MAHEDVTIIVPTIDAGEEFRGESIGLLLLRSPC